LKKILLFLSVLILSISGCDNSADTPAFKNRPSMVRHSTVAPAGVDAGEEVTTPRLTMKLSANQAASGMPQLRGVNLTGGELEWGTKPVTNPVSGTDYLFVSHQDIDYLASKNINFVRLLFSWEAIQPNGVSTPLATTGNNGIYVSTFIDRVNYASSKGMYVMIEPHGASSDNFAKYKGNFVGSSAVPNSAFADLWSRLAMQFKGNPYVVYGLSNEPNGMSTVQWFQAAQAAIVAIRDAGSTGLILVPGNGWTGASSWTQNWYDTATTKVSNAQAYLKYINDPLGNTAVSVHNYFDADASGGATSVVSSTIGSERLKVVVDWAKAITVEEFALT
jgi:endoglucanase